MRNYSIAFILQVMKLLLRRRCAAGLGIFCLPFSCLADEPDLRRQFVESSDLEMEVVGQLNSAEFDRRYEAEAELNTEFVVPISDMISINADTKFGKLISLEDEHKDQAFAFEFEELYVKFSSTNADLKVGKFVAHFGLAHDDVPGLYGDFFTNEYELDERLGIDGGVQWQDAFWGELELRAALFTTDTSFLSSNLLDINDGLRLRDGGAGNTKYPESFAVTLTGSNPENIEALTYHIGYEQQAPGLGSDLSEKGVVFGTKLEDEESDDGSLQNELFFEVAHFWNWDAEEIDRTFATLASVVSLKPWETSLSVTSINSTEQKSGDLSQDLIIQGTVSYTHHNGTTLELAAGYIDEEGNDGLIAGAKLTIPLVDADN